MIKSGRMEGMPRYASPQDPAWSEDLDASIRAFGVSIRQQIVKYLRINGPSMRIQIERGTGLSTGNVSQSLKVLEGTGVVVVDLKGVERSTRPLTYSVDAKRAEYLWRLQGNYLLGYGSTSTE